MMKLADVKNFFPFNPLEAYHKDLGYSIPFETIEDLPLMIRDAKVTHFTTIDNTVVVYCEG